MFPSTFRCAPEAFYRIRTLKGVCGFSLNGVREWSPWEENAFRAFHRAKVSSQVTHVNTVGCIFSQKPN